MSVNLAMMSGVSGLQANGTAINVIGNNISNVNTVGFKYGRTLFEDMLSQDIAGTTSQVGLGTSVQAIQNIFSQGDLLPADNVTDLAISGDGFFVVQDNAATPTTKYTRAGAFNIDSKGQYLLNANGDKLCDSSGAPIDLTSLASFSSIKNIASDGTISYLDTNGALQTSTVKIGIALFTSPVGLEKTGGNDYVATDDSGAATVAVPDQRNRIMSNRLEQSNVDMATQMVDLIITQRAYSANSKSVTTADEMTTEAINLKR